MTVFNRNRQNYNILKRLGKTLAYSSIILYNVECWSLTAMKREVADTPGRFAMACVWEIFVENVYNKIGAREGK